MKSVFKIIGILGVFVGIFLTVFAVIVFSSFPDMCGNRIIKKINSPNKRNTIVIFERDCGATTNFSTQISIIRKGKKLENEKGNLFSADSDNGKAEVNKYGIIKVQANWIDEKHILIKFDKNAQIYERKNSLNGISVTYEEISTGT